MSYHSSELLSLLKGQLTNLVTEFVCIDHYQTIMYGPFDYHPYLGVTFCPSSLHDHTMILLIFTTLIWMLIW